MVPGCNAQSCIEIVHNCPDECLPLQGRIEGSIDRQSRHDGESKGRDDLNVLWQSREGDGRQRALLGEDLANVVRVMIVLVHSGGLAFSIGVVVTVRVRGGFIGRVI